MTTSSAPSCGDADEPSNVLVLAPRIGAHEDRACSRLFAESAAEETHAIMVAYGSSAEERLAIWSDDIGANPVEATVVDVETVTRSAAAASASDGAAESQPSNVRYKPVSDPTALIELGTTLDACLQSATPARHTALCFHTLTDVLQYSERREVSKFLNVLTGNVDRAGAVAHYHLDPAAHDDATVELFGRFCDAIVDVRDVDSSLY